MVFTPAELFVGKPGWMDAFYARPLLGFGPWRLSYVGVMFRGYDK